MFKIGSPLFVVLSRIADIIILNLLFIVCSLPIFTIGAAWTALYYVTVKMVKNEESYIWKDFFKSFKQNFRQATIIWIINLIVLAFFITDISIIYGGYRESVPTVFLVLLIVVGFLILAEMTYVYPVLSHFDNTIKNTLRNAFLLSLGNLPYTVVFIIVSIIPALIFLLPSGVYLIPLVFFAGFSLPAFLCSIGWKKIFLKLEPSEEPGGVNEQKENEE